MDFSLPDLTLPLAAAYAEIHYRFRFFPFSRYFRRQPEILVDAPRRLEPGSALPLLLLIKDADQFPVQLHQVSVEAVSGDQTIRQMIALGGEEIRQRWWHHIEWIDLPDASPCQWDVRVIWQVVIDGKACEYTNSNLSRLANLPLQVDQPGHTLPATEGWIFGDLHAHTAFSEDQIEYGAPLAAFPALGKAAGLSFMMAGDHSYDLDDLPGSFCENDPQLARYHFRQAQITRLNEEHQGSFCILPGFELSVGNHRSRNVHLLLIDQPDFLPGSGDSAERWLETTPELSITETLQRMNPAALAVAAHPLSKPPFLQKWLLHRGYWEPPDLAHEQLLALQIWNGTNGSDFEEGLEVWVQGLSAGRRWKIFGGSDAHGNFNRHLKVGIPMLDLSLREDQLFGSVRTGIKTGPEVTREKVLEGLKTAPSLITDGPFVDVRIQQNASGPDHVVLTALSSPEFGALKEVKLLGGGEGAVGEDVLLREKPAHPHRWETTITMDRKVGYIRAAVVTQTGRRAFTNPVFVSARPS